MSHCGSTLYKAAIGRDRAASVATVDGLGNRWADLAASDVYWDKIVSIEPDGDDEVFDLTVDGLQSFVS